MEMRSLGKMTSALGLQIIIALLLFGYTVESSARGPSSSDLIEEQTHLYFINFNSTTAVSVQVDTKTVFSCYTYSMKNLIMAIWKIFPRDKILCIMAYRSDKNETKEINCFNERITWESRPDQNLALQIDQVTIEDDGYYMCVVVTPDGNFQSGHWLNVLVPPETSLSVDGNGTATCEASAGKPAAQISWVPEGYCLSVNETHGNRTVTVKSMCHWNGLNETKVTCSISHLTGNKSLSIELLPSRLNHFAPLLLCISLCVLLSIMTIMGFILIWKAVCHRNCESQRTRSTPNINMNVKAHEQQLKFHQATCQLDRCHNNAPPMRRQE
ncbi:cell surface glycoprotein CD200 receptor 2-like isoform X2 [Vombatus ursinus]|uniref:cell surface glycoprotein CD200 receptor 2-like isoform X2 n=1 Tax=Vombatus ursinus TaxID=29139 RepID=UPI000FFD7480|nr:cell surface glycoprotein CD200 receptor 2-like isoform X2 [Vombatus ursinus]